LARSIHRHRTFTRNVDEQVRWLERHRPVDDVLRFRAALDAFARRISANPGVGEEVAVTAARSYRVFRLGSGLPYRIWYGHAPGANSRVIALLMLLHDSQDRERFDPTEFE
jgi:plasmid stabilization system protein ParE